MWWKQLYSVFICLSFQQCLLPPFPPGRCFSWRFPHSLCTESFHFLRNLVNKGTRDDRPVTAFYHEPENKSSAAGELEKTNTKSAKQGESEVEGEDELKEVDPKKSDEQTNPEEHPPAASGDTSAASNTAPPGSEDPSEVLDMVQVFLDSPGGACVVSLSLLSLGLLSVHISIPRQMVVVDSSLVDKDIVKR